MRSRKSIHDEAYKAFVVNLAGLRQERGLSQAEFARIIGRPQSLVSGVESGSRRLDVLEYVLWVTTLGYEPEELIAALKNDLHKHQTGTLWRAGRLTP